MGIQNMRRFGNGTDPAWRCRSCTRSGVKQLVTAMYRTWSEKYLGAQIRRAMARKQKAPEDDPNLRTSQHLVATEESSPSRWKEKSARWVMGSSFASEDTHHSLTSHLLPSHSISPSSIITVLHHFFKSSSRFFNKFFIPVQVTTKWDSNITHLLATTHSHLSLLSH